MTVVLGRNIPALRAQRRLGDVTDTLARVNERLSSGMRINRASDDAAGLAVATDLEAQSRITNRARLNVGDGVSALQIASGALTAISELVTRMAELAEQAANGTLSSLQREPLDKEYQQLSQEIQRIVSSTEFNDVKLLEGERAESLSTSQVSNVNSYAFATPGDGRYLAQIDSVTRDLTVLDLENGSERFVLHVTAGITNLTQSSGAGMVAFTSTEDLIGENAGGFNQIYTVDTNTGQIKQITHAPGADVYAGVQLSADGSTVMFLSRVQYDENGAQAGFNATQSLHTVDIQSGTYDRLTSLVSSSNYYSISANGQYVSMMSSNDFAGNNAAGHNEIFVFNSNDLNGSVQQVTDFAGNAGDIASNRMFVTTNGDVYFASTIDHDGGGGTIAKNIFFVDRDSSAISQITESANAIEAWSASADGSVVHFLSNDDIIGENTEAVTQLYRYSTTSSGIEQITDYQADHTADNFTAISRDGSKSFRIGAGTLTIWDHSRDDFEFDIEAGSGASGRILTTVQGAIDAIQGLGAYSIGGQPGARAALDAATVSIEGIAEVVGSIGAGMSRLQSAERLLSSQYEQILSARSRIVDADIAAESADLVRAQISQQAATAVLAQANQQPALALQLLGG